MTRPHPDMARFLVFCALLIAVWTSERPALGHAALLETQPASGTVLAAAPREIVLRFSETVTPISLTLIRHEGDVLLPATAHDTVIRAAVPGALPDGTYIVSYRVVSADSHPIGGSLLFVVGTPSADAPAATNIQQSDDGATLVVAVNRILLLVCLFFSAGGVLFAAGVLGMASPIARRLYPAIRLGATVGLGSALTAIVLQGALLAGGPLTDSAAWRDGAFLRIGWQSSLGQSATLICFGLLVTIAFLGRGTRRGPRWLSLAGAALALGALAVSGHGMTASPRWLALTAVAAHGLMIGFWAGSLWPLLRCLDLPSDQAIAIVTRFSKLAVIAVALLIGSGVMLAILQLGGEVAALVNTPYGQLLLLKLAVVALLLLLAAHNKWRLTPALARGEPDAAARLGIAIRLEIATVGFVIVVTALLSQTPPPRAIAVDRQAVVALHGAHEPAAPLAQTVTLRSKGYAAAVTLTPARVGRNHLLMALQAPDGTPLDALEASVEFSLEPVGIEPLSEPLRGLGAGRYDLTTDALLQPGHWRFGLAVLIDDFERLRFDAVLAVEAR